jgi:hypothetical protein
LRELRTRTTAGTVARCHRTGADEAQVR